MKQSERKSFLKTELDIDFKKENLKKFAGWKIKKELLIKKQEIFLLLPFSP